MGWILFAQLLTLIGFVALCIGAGIQVYMDKAIDRDLVQAGVIPVHMKRRINGTTTAD